METLRIVPLGNISSDILRIVARTLEKTYNLKVRVIVSNKVPKEAYNPSRGQYLAEKILNWLKKKFGSRVFAITAVDLYAEGLNFIFGQAELGGKVAIISICRLKPEFYGLLANEKLFFERVEKEATHEMGHTFNLMHCNNKNCVMSFSNSILEVDRKSKNLCEKCTTKLNLTS